MIEVTANGTRQPTRWTWLGVLVVGIVLFELVLQTLLSTQNPNLIPALLLLGASIAPAAFVTFIRGRRLDYSVSGGVIAGVAFVGGVVGVVTAGTLEYDTLRSLGPLAVVGVGVIEECSKLLAPAAVLWFGRWRTPADGLLIGVASGAGFAALETMGYAFVTLVQTKGNIGAVDDVLLLRGLMSPAAHMAWTGLTAAALWRAAQERWTGRATVRFLAVLAGAIALHALWDGLGSLLADGVIAVIGLALLTWTAHRISHPRLISDASPTGHDHAYR